MKLRGLRIELGEIAAVLREQPGAAPPPSSCAAPHPPSSASWRT
ncbi:hypothetical protein [Micromonospora sp. b486]